MKCVLASEGREYLSGFAISAMDDDKKTSTMSVLCNARKCMKGANPSKKVSCVVSSRKLQALRTPEHTGSDSSVDSNRKIRNSEVECLRGRASVECMKKKNSTPARVKPAHESQTCTSLKIKEDGERAGLSRQGLARYQSPWNVSLVRCLKNERAVCRHDNESL